MSKNIVILSGSPRKNGNTEKLVTAFREGAESAGKKVRVYEVAGMKISGCVGCRHCFESKGICVQKDDMVGILEAIREADAFVLASPVYFFGVTAQLKLAIDRTFALLSVDTPIKRAALLMTCGNPDVSVGDGAVTMYNWMRNRSNCNWEDAGVIIAGGLRQPDAMNGREEIEKARQLGRDI